MRGERVQLTLLYTCGSSTCSSDWPDWARAAAESGSIPAVREPDDFTLIVAGADLPIPQHAYCPSWGHPPCRVTREIVLPGTMAGP